MHRYTILCRHSRLHRNLVSRKSVGHRNSGIGFDKGAGAYPEMYRYAVAGELELSTVTASPGFLYNRPSDS